MRQALWFGIRTMASLRSIAIALMVAFPAPLIFGDESPPLERKTLAPQLNSERIEAKFGSYGIEILQDTPYRVSMLYSEHEGEKICRTFAIVSFQKEIPETLASPMREIHQGGSLGATLKKFGWAIEKAPLVIGTTPAGPRFVELAKLEEPQEIAFSIYDLTVRSNDESYLMATLMELHHPAYLDIDQLRKLNPSAPAKTENSRALRLKQLAIRQMQR